MSYGLHIIGKRVFVGMSGGVDSSVSAALLKEAGFDVTGVFIKVWQPDWQECNWREDRLDAMRVCAKIGIPFRDLDLSREYKREVVDYMVSEYKAGKTPNPDVFCNRYIKFGGFFNWAIRQGADFVATGHYARIREFSIFNFQFSKKTENRKLNAKSCTLYASIDEQKDQSYFLWTLTQRELSHTLFPVGGMTKPEVRRLAKKFDLPTAEKKDSQGLCFIGKVDLKDFLSHFIKPKRGNVLDESGKVVGFHDGAFFLTIGQRHGFTINKKGDSDVPKFIVRKNIKKNTVTVSDKPALDVSPEVGAREIEIKDTNWIADKPKKNVEYFARIRYRAPLFSCKIFLQKGKCAKVTFGKPVAYAAPGQSLVVYTKDGECLGGGIIE